MDITEEMEDMEDMEARESREEERRRWGPDLLAGGFEPVIFRPAESIFTTLSGEVKMP